MRALLSLADPEVIKLRPLMVRFSVISLFLMSAMRLLGGEQVTTATGTQRRFCASIPLRGIKDCRNRSARDRPVEQS